MKDHSDCSIKSLKVFLSNITRVDENWFYGYWLQNLGWTFREVKQVIKAFNKPKLLYKYPNGMPQI